MPEKIAQHWDNIGWVVLGSLAVYLLMVWHVSRQARRRGYSFVVWFLACLVSTNPLLMLILLTLLPDARKLRLRQAEMAALEEKLRSAAPAAPAARDFVAGQSVGDQPTTLPPAAGPSVGDVETRL